MAASGGNEPLQLYRTLFKIAKELDKNELEGMKFLCNGIINRSTLEEIDTPLKLFTELTKVGRITETDFSFLEKLLAEIGRQDLLTLLTTLRNDQNTPQQTPPVQPSSANQFQQVPDASTGQQRQQALANLTTNRNGPNAAGQKLAPFQNLGNVPPAAAPPISSPQHADSPPSPQQNTGLSTPGTSGPHHGLPASPPTPPDDTIPKCVPNFPASYQTPPKHLRCHGEAQSHVEGKQTTMQEMREQREHAAEIPRSEPVGTPGIPTSPKQFHSPDTVGSLDKTPTLTELHQHTHDATDALHRMKHEQEEIQNEGKMTSVAEIQGQLHQYHLPDTAGSMDKTTSHVELQQHLQAAQVSAVPAGIHQGAVQSEGDDLYLMGMNKQWEQQQAMTSPKQAGILPRTPPQQHFNRNKSSTPTQSSPSQHLDEDVVEDSPSNAQDVNEATSLQGHRTLHNITYQTPSSISTNIGQSPILSSGRSEDLEVDSPTKPEELETGPAVRPKVRPVSPPPTDTAIGASPIRLDVAQEDMPEGQYSGKVALREYQKELARSALQGKNAIITCATGSGKTLVSALVAERAWSVAKRRGLPFKALFIVPIRNLTKQQKDQFEMLFPLGVVQEIGDTEELSETLKKKHIVMLTAQIVVNSLKAGSLDLTDLDQLILDECHHTTLDHPYNQIMRYYLKKKSELAAANPHQKSLPQVIGLTASLGVGGSGNALQHLIELCASLDASRVDHVKENREELRRHVFTPDAIHILSGQPRKPHDPFSTALDSLMQRLESKVFPDTCPYDRGTQQCENWIVERIKEAEAKTMRNELIVAQYLFDFNRALRLFTKLRAADAIAFLDEKIYQSRAELKGPPKLPIDKFCYQQFNQIRDELCVYAEEEETQFPNPMLQQLRSLLIQKFDEPESYGIVLTQQRRETEAIVQYVEEQDVLRGKMRAKRLVGQGKLEDKAITDAQQMAVLKSFRKGLSYADGCNLLVATDVAQEGLDMPKCNFVIRYDFVSNEIGSVQARGRARAKDAECYLLVTAGSTNERRELENQEKEAFMIEALNEMDQLTQVDFDSRVKAEQARQLESWKEKQKNKSTRKSLLEAKDVKVYCRQCNWSVCDGTDIVHKGSNYICREPTLPDRCQIVCSKNPQVYRTTDNIGLLFCGNSTCRNQYGPIIKYKKGQEETAYGMNVKSFLFDCGNGELRAIAKWSKAPFDITEEPYV
ncbi:ATP-dependent RNA helicase DHX58-like [Branchiostoma floridae x Branchiostoma japonicum]